jgi:hypothetical protein
MTMWEVFFRIVVISWTLRNHSLSFQKLYKSVIKWLTKFFVSMTAHIASRSCGGAVFVSYGNCPLNFGDKCRSGTN